MVQSYKQKVCLANFGSLGESNNELNLVSHNKKHVAQYCKKTIRSVPIRNLQIPSLPQGFDWVELCIYYRYLV